MVIATCKVLIRVVHVIGLNDGNTALRWSRILTDKTRLPTSSTRSRRSGNAQYCTRCNVPSAYGDDV